MQRPLKPPFAVPGSLRQEPCSRKPARSRYSVLSSEELTGTAAKVRAPVANNSFRT